MNCCMNRHHGWQQVVQLVKLVLSTVRNSPTMVQKIDRGEGRTTTAYFKLLTVCQYEYSDIHIQPR